MTAVFNRLKKNGVVMRSQIYNCHLAVAMPCIHRPELLHISYHFLV